MADIQFIEDTPEVEKIADKYNREAEKDHARLWELQEQILIETKSAKKRLDKTLKEKKISDEELAREITDYENILSGRTGTSNPLPLSLFHAFADIIRKLNEIGATDVSMQFAHLFDHQGTMLVEKFTFSKAIEDGMKSLKK